MKLPLYATALAFSASLTLAGAPHTVHAAEDMGLHTLTLETDELKPVQGHQGGTLGARIDAVESLDNGEMIKISVSLPKPTLAHESDIEEVIVMGVAPKKETQRPLLDQGQKVEVVNDLEQGRSGIVIYLKKQQNFVLQLNYTEPRPDVEPDVFSR